LQIQVKTTKIVSDIIDAEQQNFVVELAQGDSIADLIGRLAIPEKYLPIIVFHVNGSNARQDYILKDGDQVSIYPVVGGG